VSVRLLAELERGERPNVSLETALRLLSLVGLSVVATPRPAQVAEPQHAWLDEDRAARAERAALRRRTWTGRHVSLEESGTEPDLPRSIARRIEAVSEVSQLAYAVARAVGRSKTAKGPKGAKSAKTARTKRKGR
jgi:hypothetical protein